MDAETANGARHYPLPCALSRLQSGSTEEIQVGTFLRLPAVVQKQDDRMAIFLEGRALLGWSEVQHRY
jgi:hypothetical protein